MSGPEGPEHAPVAGTRRTLPPPEWLGRDGPRSAASLALERYRLRPAVARRSGPRAELAALLARVAPIDGDEESERAAASAVARALAARGTELDVATRLGRRALLLGEDPKLREELAGWFVSLGEHALAASTLRPLVERRTGKEASALLIRIGVLLARAGEARAAAEALGEATELYPHDPVAPETLAALSAWAPHALVPEKAAEAYLAAAARRQAQGDRATAFENLMRAFEIAPHHAEAADKLAEELQKRGRPGAADEVRREHADRAVEGRRSVHLKRMRQAVKDGDLPRALGAAFDAGLDAEIDLRSVLSAIDSLDAADEAPLGIDGLLERANLHELLAARVELASDFLAGRERARARVALGRLYAGPLGKPDRAAEAFIEALVADAACRPALDALHRHVSVMRDHAPLVQALVRVGDQKALGAQPERIACLRELVALAEERLGDPGLAAWANGRLLVVLPDSAELRDTAARLEPRLRLQDEALASARSDLDNERGEARVPALKRLAMLLSGRPDQVEAYLEVLRELAERLPEERSFQIATERALSRLGRQEDLERFLRSLLERAASPVDKARLRLSLGTLRSRAGDSEGALAELSPLIGEPGVHGAAFSLTLLLAGQLGDRALRARALARIASSLGPSLRAVLLAVAAEELFQVGQLEAARAAAEQACNADPSLARPAAVRARVGLRLGGRAGVEAAERAMGIVVPRAELCGALAVAYDALGEPLLGAAWAQRQVTLRPGDLDAAVGRLTRAMRGDDGGRLADTLAWLLSQPQSLTSAAPVVAAALERLLALAPGRSGALARRALDVLGPRDERLREAVLAIADEAGERGLGIAAIERFLATGSLGQERAKTLLDLARRRREAGDADGAARALLRALKEGASPNEVMSLVNDALPTRTSDGELALLEVRAEALSALPEADQLGTAGAWRELGAALWDLADDQLGALRAWERGLSLDVEHGVESFAADLIAFSGTTLAVERLVDHARRREPTPEAARFYVVAANVALGAGRAKDAFEYAAKAIELDPTRTEMIAVAERTAGDEDAGALDRIFDRLAEGALGRYGERAVHYRAARQLERRGVMAAAMRHAVGAFEAVPSEGVVFVTLARIADRAGERSEMVRAIERVAQLAPLPERRAAWLRRAAVFTSDSDEGQRQRVEVLLRALAVRAEVDLVRTLDQALAELLKRVPEEREIARLRFERAASSVLRRVEGPEGGRIAIEIARSALGTFDQKPLALSALACAADTAGDLEEFAAVLEHSEALAQASESAEFVTKLLSLAEQRFASAGGPLFELGAAIARARGELKNAARLLVAAALRHPEDRELVERAERSARAAGDPELISAVLEAVPDRDRFALLMDLADARERAADVDQALAALERAQTLEGLEPDQHAELTERWIRLLTQANRRDDLERVLEKELARRDLPRDVEPRLARELAAIVGARGRPLSALAVLSSALERVPDHPGMLADLLELARQAGEREKQAFALGRLLDLGIDPSERTQHLRELALLLQSLGDETAALSRFSELAELEPNDPDALVALERDAERHADYESLVQLLARRAAVVGRVEDVRRLRLRRATVLEQRLARPDEARAELEALIASTGDHLSVLRVLADLNERLGDLLKAAPLWLRASALAGDRSEAADLGDRACRAYLTGGDVEAAHRVLAGMQAWAPPIPLAELSVEIERRREDPLKLAEALEDLAALSEAAAEVRAELLVEAARASLVAGDRERALERARRASELSPSYADAGALVRELQAAHYESPAPVFPLVTSTAPPQKREHSPVPEAVRGPALARTETEPEPAPDSPRVTFHIPEPPATDPLPVDALRQPASAPESPPSSRSAPRSRAPDSPRADSPRPDSPRPDSPRAVRPRAEQPSLSGTFVAASADEAELYRALALGSIGAGRELHDSLAGQADRERDRLAICRKLALLDPGNPATLEKLVDAARADRDFAYAQAVSHVIEIVRPSGTPIEPPPIAETTEQPEAVRGLLFRDATSAALEALTLVWEGAGHLFRRDPSAYGITGLERVQPTAPTPLARSFSGAARAFGMLRTPLFQRRTAGPVTVSVALLSPPAVVLAGEVSADTPVLRFHLGAMLAAATPAFVLLFGTPESQARSILKSLSFAFGPPNRDPTGLGPILNMAELLWESIPARLQRRLREICDDEAGLDYATALSSARTAVRRAGLYVCGDLGVALREICADEELDPALIETPSGFGSLCESSPSIQSLYSLAVSSEYAETRWRTPRSTPRG